MTGKHQGMMAELFYADLLPTIQWVVLTHSGTDMGAEKLGGLQVVVYIMRQEGDGQVYHMPSEKIGNQRCRHLMKGQCHLGI